MKDTDPHPDDRDYWYKKLKRWHLIMRYDWA